MAKRFFEAGRGVFKCAMCGRPTRLTTQPSSSAICAECDELAMLEISIFDGCQTVKESKEFRDQMANAAIAKGGSPKMILSNFSSLWEE